MSLGSIFPVKIHRIILHKIFHNLPYLILHRCDQHMKMCCHQAITMYHKRVFLPGPPKYHIKYFIIFFISVKSKASHTSRHYMILRILIPDSNFTDNLSPPYYINLFVFTYFSLIKQGASESAPVLFFAFI